LFESEKEYEMILEEHIRNQKIKIDLDFTSLKEDLL
jgi:hypothetical protein